MLGKIKTLIKTTSILLIILASCLPYQDSRTVPNKNALLLNYYNYAQIQTYSPPKGVEISNINDVKIFFNSSMNPATLKLSGSLLPYYNGGRWSKTNYDNDTLIISPMYQLQWPSGPLTLSLNCSNTSGLSLPVTFNSNYTVNASLDYIDYIMTFDDGTYNNLYGGTLSTWGSDGGELSFDVTNDRRGGGYALKTTYHLSDPAVPGVSDTWFAPVLSIGSSNKDISKYTNFTMYAKKDSSTINSYLRICFKDLNNSEVKIPVDLFISSLTNSYQLISIPIASLNNFIDITKLNYIFIGIMYADLSAKGYSANGTIYIDDIACTGLSSGAGSGGSTTLPDPYIFEDFSSGLDFNLTGGTYNSEAKDALCNITHTYDATNYNLAPKSARLVYSVASGKWGCKFVVTFGQIKDCSSFNYLVVSVKGGDNSSQTPEKIKLEMSDSADPGYNHNVPLIPDNTTTPSTPITSSAWRTYTIPLTAFDGGAQTFDKSSLKELAFSFHYDTVGTNKSGVVYIDDLKFTK